MYATRQPSQRHKKRRIFEDTEYYDNRSAHRSRTQEPTGTAHAADGESAASSNSPHLPSAAQLAPASDSGYSSEEDVHRWVYERDYMELSQPTGVAQQEQEQEEEEQKEGEVGDEFQQLLTDTSIPPPLEQPSIPVDEPNLREGLTEEEAASLPPVPPPVVDPTQVQQPNPFGDQPQSDLSFDNYQELREFMDIYGKNNGFAVIQKGNNGDLPVVSMVTEESVLAAAAAASGHSILLAGPPAAAEETIRVPFNGRFMCEYYKPPETQEQLMAKSPKRKKALSTQMSQDAKRMGCPFQVNFSRHKSDGRYYINKRVLIHSHFLQKQLDSHDRTILHARQLNPAMHARMLYLLRMHVPRDHIYRFIKAEFNLLVLNDVLFKNWLYRSRQQLGYGNSGQQVQMLVHWMQERAHDGKGKFDLRMDEHLLVHLPDSHYVPAPLQTCALGEQNSSQPAGVHHRTVPPQVDARLQASHSYPPSSHSLLQSLLLRF